MCKTDARGVGRAPQFKAQGHRPCCHVGQAGSGNMLEIHTRAVNSATLCFLLAFKHAFTHLNPYPDKMPRYRLCINIKWQWGLHFEFL